MGSDRCLTNLEGRLPEGVMRERCLSSLKPQVLIFTDKYLQHSYLFQHESPSQVDCYFWSSFEATKLETINQDYYYSWKVPLPRAWLWHCTCEALYTSRVYKSHTPCVSAWAIWDFSIWYLCCHHRLGSTYQWRWVYQVTHVLHKPWCWSATELVSLV